MPAAPLPSLSRRALIAGTLAAVAAPAVLGGCSTEPEPVAPTPDETALDYAVSSAESLLAAYSATASAHPGLAPRLDPLAADHREHLAVLAPGPSPTASAEGSPTPTPTPAVPAEPTAAVAALAAGETAAAAALATRLGPIDADLARTLASVAACRSAHAADLGGAM